MALQVSQRVQKGRSAAPGQGYGQGLDAIAQFLQFLAQFVARLGGVAFNALSGCPDLLPAARKAAFGGPAQRAVEVFPLLFRGPPPPVFGVAE